MLADGEGLGRLRLVYESRHTSYQSYYQSEHALRRRTVLLDSAESRRSVKERLRNPAPIEIAGGYDHGS